jgi:hypothetical protein
LEHHFGGGGGMHFGHLDTQKKGFFEKKKFNINFTNFC